MATSAPPSFSVNASNHFSSFLFQEELSLAFTTYQTNRLFFVGSQENGQLSLSERLFDKPMGLYQSGQRLYMGTRYQIWTLQNHLQPGEVHGKSDRLYIPHTSHTTGDINAHDVVLDRDGNLVFVNTDFSCLATLSPDYSFKPLWQPPFISSLAPEDRCHLNGVTLVDGTPKYVTACSTTDEAAGWRNHRVDGGVVMDISSNAVIATGLSMPHSPRWYRDRLWVLNSGTGEFGSIDLETGQFQPLVFCPGFVRGLAFWKQYAVIGLSKLRSQAFTGLKLEERLQQQGQQAQCGLVVVDLDRGEIVHGLQLQGPVEELFDIVVLPGVRQPRSLGLKNDDIQRLVTFPGSDGIRITKPTVARPSQGTSAPVAGLPNAPRQSSSGAAASRGNTPPKVEGAVKFQSVFHLNASNIEPYDELTFPRLRKRWRTRPPQGELVGVSASIAGTMVGLAIAELQEGKSPRSPNAELISLLVLPAYRQQGIGTRLVKNLEDILVEQNCSQLQVTYRVSPATQAGLEPLLQHRGWSAPRLQFLLGKTTTEKISQAPWVHRTKLPERFSIVPWSELTETDKTQLQALEYPASLNPFGSDPRVESLNSLVLRHGNQAVGWMLTHRVAPDTIRYSSMFVAPSHQRMGRGVALLVEAIRRQMNSAVPYYSWSVAADNSLMSRFLKRRLAPYSSYLGESRCAEKSLL